MRVALYARVSTEEQATKYGLGSQLTELRAIAARAGHDVATAAEFVDDGYSGADLNRPALDRLRAAARAGAVDVLFIHDPDRLSRKLAHQVLLMEELERAHVDVQFATITREPTAEGRLLLQVKGVIAEYERTKIIERTSRGRREKARRGLVVSGTYAYGYRRDPAAAGTLLVVDDEAGVVRMMFRWLVDEQRSVRSIATELRRLGIKPRRGRTWAKSSVARILTNATYAGRAWFNRREAVPGPEGKAARRRMRPEAQWIQITVPAIVTPATFEAGQAQLEHNRGHLVGRPPTHAYLLRGLAVCGSCGRRLYGGASHGRAIYRCAGRDRMREAAGRCPAPTIAAAVLEPFIWRTVVDVLRDPALLTEKLHTHTDRLGVREIEVRSEAEHLARQVAALERQEQRLLDLYLADEAALAVVQPRLAQLAEHKAGLKERQAAATRQAAAHRAQEGQQDAIRRLCAEALAGIDRLTAVERQALLGHLLERVVVRTGEYELHGWLPARGKSTRPAARDGRFSATARYVVLARPGRE